MNMSKFGVVKASTLPMRERRKKARKPSHPLRVSLKKLLSEALRK